MNIETAKGTFGARAVTLAERRELAALMTSVWSSDAHGPVQNGPNLARLCERVARMLEPQAVEALEALGVYEQNAVLIEVAAKLIEGVSGKGSGA